MVLTKEDLNEWNNHPVTQAIFKDINESLAELQAEPVVKETADQTAMQAVRNQGQAEGINSLLDAYHIALEEVEGDVQCQQSVKN